VVGDEDAGAVHGEPMTDDAILTLATMVLAAFLVWRMTRLIPSIPERETVTALLACEDAPIPERKD
jgi:hypothetical protein